MRWLQMETNEIVCLRTGARAICESVFFCLLQWNTQIGCMNMDMVEYTLLWKHTEKERESALYYAPIFHGIQYEETNTKGQFGLSFFFHFSTNYSSNLGLSFYVKQFDEHRKSSEWRKNKTKQNKNENKTEVDQSQLFKKILASAGQNEKKDTFCYAIELIFSLPTKPRRSKKLLV